ncbi:MAG TPA: hypothetical protein VGE62_00245 [Candidatus Paceibacterota bacterium]
MQKVRKYAWIVVAALVIFGVFFGASTKRPSESQSSSFELEKNLGNAIDGSKKAVDNALRPGRQEAKRTGEKVTEMITLRKGEPQTVYSVGDWTYINYSFPPSAPVKVTYNAKLYQHKKLVGEKFERQSLEVVFKYYPLNPKEEKWMVVKGENEVPLKQDDFPESTSWLTFESEIDGLVITLTGTHK